MPEQITTNRRFVVSPTTYSTIAAVALGALCVIVFTGALVRLTGSGLGCSDWPRCNTSKFVDVSGSHAAIEQVNRLFTGVVSASVIAAVLAAYRRSVRDVVLIKWAWTLVLGVLGQVVLGGVVVLTGLNPYANMGHFLLSMVLVTCAFILWRCSHQTAAAPRWRWSRLTDRRLRVSVVAFLSLAVAVMVAGTVVTATGPHAGDEDAVRFGFELRTVARIHSLLVMALLVASFAAFQMARRLHDADLLEALRMFFVVAFAQAGVGYAQYFTSVPVFLVTLHIAGATAFWLSVCGVAVARR